LKAIGHSLNNLGPSQKTLRHPLCPNLVTDLIAHSLKIWAPQKTLRPTWYSKLAAGLGKTVWWIGIFDE